MHTFSTVYITSYHSCPSHFSSMLAVSSLKAEAMPFLSLGYKTAPIMEEGLWECLSSSTLWPFEIVFTNRIFLAEGYVSFCKIGFVFLYGMAVWTFTERDSRKR